MKNTFSISGIIISSNTITKLGEEIPGLLSTNGSPKQLITLNTDFLRILYYDKEFKSICTNSCIVVPDGIGVVILLFLKYHKFINKITGFDLFEICLRISNKNTLRLALVGSAEETHLKLTTKIRSEYPNIILKTISPQYEFEKVPYLNDKIVNELKEFSPDILFAALGCPRQEKWIYKNKDLIGAKINIGVGSVFDFYAGTKKRAPKFVRKIWLEWLWRLLNEPKRLFKRYILQDLPFLIRTSVNILLRIRN